MKAMIVGAGSIGATKPDNVDYPGGPNILTHAHAYHAHPGTDLCCVVDQDEEKARAASFKWEQFDRSCAHSASLTEAIRDHLPEIISVCTPTETHLAVVRDICTERNVPAPMVVVVEKPCGRAATECREIVELCAEAHIFLMVNYQRRFCSSFQLLRSRFLLGKERPLAATLAYGRGLKRDGCHAIDLFRFLFGECFYIDGTSEVQDYLPEDQTIGGLLKFERCPYVALIAVDSRHYGLFDLNIYTNLGMHRFSGYTRFHAFYAAAPETVMGQGYNSLSPAVTPMPDTGVDKYCLTAMVDEAAMIASGFVWATACCRGEDAIAVHEIMERLV